MTEMEIDTFIHISSVSEDSHGPCFVTRPDTPCPLGTTTMRCLLLIAVVIVAIRNLLTTNAARGFDGHRKTRKSTTTCPKTQSVWLERRTTSDTERKRVGDYRQKRCDNSLSTPARTRFGWLAIGFSDAASCSRGTIDLYIDNATIENRPY